ncbi:hypothetical protein [Nocardioides sp.]|uniref:hypothetical protein n=1 Tax=Nocardioides sp. TaxID=35761 RepID=UPI001A354CB6|nr:hypothetical protein [Nocardioides sp.]MBJ7357619.1 hypothetical protein [Nocardioides sp.]
MATTLGDATGLGDAATPAQRVRRPGWRDPRLAIGIVLVAGSVVAGARLLAAADDTVQVWTAASDLGAGARLTEDDLVAARVRFADEDAQDGYYAVDDELPADLELLRGVGAGELLARSAVGPSGASGLVEVPIAVEPEQVPPSVTAGAVVDVYVVATPDAEEEAPGTTAEDGPALAGVTVVDAPALAESFGTSGRRQLVLAVPEADTAAFFALLGSHDSAVMTVVRRG